MLSDPVVDAYNVRVGTQTFSGLYKFTTNTLLVETAEAITNLGSDTIKCYLGPNTSGQSGVTMPAGVTNLMLLVRNEPSYHKVLDMPFRHFIMWAYPLATGGTAFQDGNYTATEAGKDYREMYDLTRYLLTNYNNSGKTFYLGHWEGDGYLKVNNWTTNPSQAVVSAMIAWENNKQQAVDDAKAATLRTNVNVFYYAEANRVRDAMLNGTDNNVRMINAVIPYVTNLDYISYSSYDAQNLSASDLYTTLNYMEAHFPTNKAGKVPGERMWIGEYGWGTKSFDAQEPLTRAYIQRLLGWQGSGGSLPYILFWEMYNNQTPSDGGTNFCLIDYTDTKVACYYLLNRFINQAKLLVAQFKEANGRLPNDAEFSTLASTMLNAPLLAPAPFIFTNQIATLLSPTNATIFSTFSQGIYGDDEASVWVFWGTQDGGTVSNAWANSRFVGVNTNFNPTTFGLSVSNLVPQTNYYFRFYAANASNSAWAPASARFSTVTLNPPDYPYRARISFVGYNHGEILNNFPALVMLGASVPGFSYAQFLSPNGNDLRFTDASGLVPLLYEIDEWNPGGTSTVWVQVPAFSATNNYIWAYWGNPAATNRPATSTNGAVWAGNYDLVWHLAHSGFPYLDSAQQHPGATGVGPGLATGIVGHGAAFDGANSYINAGAINLGDQFTLSAWINLAASANNIQTIWANKAAGWNTNGVAFYVNTYNTTDGKLILETGDGTGGSTAATAAGVIGTGKWHHVVAAVNRAAGIAQLFVDGVDQTQTSAVTTGFNNVSVMNLGKFTNGSYHFNGTLDEVRIQNGLLSSNWVWASWMNAASNTTFASYAQVNPRPALSLMSAPTGMYLTWPASSGVVSLFTTTNLTPPIAWTPATNVPSLVDGQWQVSLSSPGAENRYFRLQYH